MDLELFFDFASNYSYPAVMLADQAAAERGLSLRFCPILLGPIFASQGYQQPPFLQFPQKGAYVMRDLERICAEFGLGWRRPSNFPRRGLLPTRIALIAIEEGWGTRFCQRVYQLNFAEDREIDDEATMRALLSELGQPADDVLARATSQSNRDRLRTETERASALGVFGAPTFVVGRELFWGHDRMRQALDWATRRQETP
jgi:2-hydroxychromene-2-carboxylate isomerase